MCEDETTTPEKRQPFEPTFSLRNLLETTLKLPGKLKNFQAFSLSNMKTISAVSCLKKQYQESITNNKVNIPFHCSKCARYLEDWPEIIQHIVQHSGTFSKHLSKMLDQSLVILNTDQGVTSVTNVLKCRKCKFYLPNFDLNQVLQHVKKCSEVSKLARSSIDECPLCGSRTHSAPSDKCVSTLKECLALDCNAESRGFDTRHGKKHNCLECNMAVNLSDNMKFPFCNVHISSHEKFVKLMKCFSNITEAFHQSHDSIEEFIVASKQQQKRQQNS